MKIVRIITLVVIFALLGITCTPADAEYTQDLNDSEAPGASDDGGQQTDTGSENSGTNEPSGGSPQTPVVVVAGIAIESTCTITPGMPATALIKLDGVPLAGASVLIDEVEVGLTDSDGNIAFVAPTFAVFEIRASYESLSRLLEIDTSEG